MSPTDHPDLLPLALLLLALGIATTIGLLVLTAPPADPRTPVRPTRRLDPPTETLLVAAEVAGWRQRSGTAQLAALVHRGVLRLDPSAPGTIEVTDATRLDVLERDFLLALLNGEPRTGSRTRLDPQDRDTAARVRRVHAAVAEVATDRGWRYRPTPRRGVWALRLTIVALLAASIPLAVQDERTRFVALALGVVALTVALPAAGRRRTTARPLTDRGAALRDHVLGVQDHLRFDERRGDGTALHPYAVALGLLPRWRRRYGDEDPTLRALIASIGGDQEENGFQDLQPDDAWAPPKPPPSD
jgi:hypothetical protein